MYLTEWRIMSGTKLLRDHPTVGVLSNWQVYHGSLPDSFLAELLEGICAAAQEKDCNLLLSCGLSHIGILEGSNHPAWPQPSPDDDFLPVGPWNTDGLIVILPFLSEARETYIRKLQGEEFPIVYLGQSVGLSPLVCIDDAVGIRLGLQHLAEHGHRQIAFIAGDTDQESDSAIRHRAFQEGMRELGLEYRPKLVRHGFHDDEIGYRVMRELLQADRTFTAVMTSDDLSGLGALRALHEAGLRVPQDVALCGFDNIPECLVQNQPMTSVHYPRLEVGRQALLKVLGVIQGNALPDKTMLEPFLVVRQSCGCGNIPVLPSKSESWLAARGGLQEKRNQILDVMIASMVRTARFPERKQQLRHFCTVFLDLFFLEDADHFLTSLECFIDDTIQAGYNPNQWQPVLAIVQEYQSVQNKVDRSTLEARSKVGHTLLCERAFRNSMSQHFQQRLQADQFGYMNIQLLSAQTEDQVLRVFYENLASIGLQPGWVTYYKPGEEDDPTECSIMWLLAEDELLSIEFTSRQFPPPRLIPPGEHFRLALLPLNYQEEVLGFVTFDAQNLDLYGSVMLSLAAALKSARLHELVLDLSLKDSLTGVANRRYFDIVMEREVQHCSRYNRALSLILFDIDNFKPYNDTYGHLAGDVALQQVAELAGSRLRRQLDTIARYGGDEFIAILTETDSEGARKIAEDILQIVRESQVFLCPLTLSIGVATLHGDQVDAQRLVDQADQALYQAKHDGRGLVRVYTGFDP